MGRVVVLIPHGGQIFTGVLLTGLRSIVAHPNPNIRKEIAVNKLFPSAAKALEGVVADGQLLAVGGFGLCGIPEALIDALRDSA